jgi:hypothetical protein
VNQLVVALPLTAITLNDAPDNPFIRRRLLPRVPQISDVALDGCLTMTPDSFGFSEIHYGSPHFIGSVVSLSLAMLTPWQALHGFVNFQTPTNVFSTVFSTQI